MRVYNSASQQALEPELSEALAQIRKKRQFCPHTYIAGKAALLNSYMQDNGLSACVAGISGGIDSAIVLAIIKAAAECDASPIMTIAPLIIPVLTKGATNQEKAADKANIVIRHLGLKAAYADFSPHVNAIQYVIDNALLLKGEAWSAGQLASYVRTPALYYAASLLAENGNPAVVVGTTNRDEGSYLGFFGKASDSMVDIQLISDIHKSEVYQVAGVLNIPDQIINAVPAGDMFDGRADEDVFGTSYDFVELYTSLLALSLEKREKVISPWSEKAKNHYAECVGKLEKLHRHNAHKYKVGSPALHLDIYESAVPGGWQYGIKSPTFPDVSWEKFVAPFVLSDSVINLLASHEPTCRADTKLNGKIDQIEALLNKAEITAIIHETNGKEWQDANHYGKASATVQQGKTGSLRLSTYNRPMADILWNRLQACVAPLFYSPADTHIDTAEAELWRPVGVNPLFRFIRYENGGSLVGHYDAPHDFGNGCKTLKSLIIYLTDAAVPLQGATRFLSDFQDELPVHKRNYSDWDRCGFPGEIVCSVDPVAGNALLFDHRILHDCDVWVPAFEGDYKLILRTDIIYQMIRYT